MNIGIKYHLSLREKQVISLREKDAAKFAYIHNAKNALKTFNHFVNQSFNH
jgi:hypothetical protein